TKPLGVETQLVSKTKDILIEGEKSRLTQVFTHILQQQIQNVLDTKTESAGKIKWKISADKEKVYFEAYDSSTLPLWDQNVSSFSYSLVGQVLRDFAASLEIPAPSSPEWKAKISFSRPVLRNN